MDWEERNLFLFLGKEAIISPSIISQSCINFLQTTRRSHCRKNNWLSKREQTFQKFSVDLKNINLDSCNCIISFTMYSQSTTSARHEFYLCKFLESILWSVIPLSNVSVSSAKNNGRLHVSDEGLAIEYEEKCDLYCFSLGSIKYHYF